MTEAKLRNQIGYLLIVGNMSVIVLILGLFFLGGFLFEEMTTTIALVFPMLSVYVVAVIKYVVAQKAVVVDQSEKVSPQYAMLSWLIPSSLVLYLICIVILKAFNIGVSSFEQFKILLTVGQTVFGGYAGLILGSMFELRKKQIRGRAL
jgi:hypothetical protein